MSIMTGILSLPSELLYAIIEACTSRERCCLRATCKVLNEHADPIVFRRLCLYLKDSQIAEHQIIALATRSSKACEFTRDLEISGMPTVLRASEKSWPHFGNCDDLRVHLPTAISMLRNLTRFSWKLPQDYVWLNNSLLQTIARLPKLTELYIWDSCETRNPLSLFANLSRLTVWCLKHDPFLISEMAIVIANSPQLRRLEVRYAGISSDTVPLPSLNALFAEIPTSNTSCLEHLAVSSIDTTMDQATLSHLTHLTSLKFGGDISTQGVWTSFLNNNINLSDVEIQGDITEEAMLYLSSFSGLKSLIVDSDNTVITEKFEMMFEIVLSKHAKSLRKLYIGLGKLVFDRTNSKSIMNYLELRDLLVRIDGRENGMSVQLLLDTVAHLPELKTLRFYILDHQVRKTWAEDFKPSPGLRYVEELEVDERWYVLEKDGGRPVRYRKINEC